MIGSFAIRAKLSRFASGPQRFEIEAQIQPPRLRLTPLTFIPFLHGQSKFSHRNDIHFRVVSSKKSRIWCIGRHRQLVDFGGMAVAHPSQVPPGGIIVKQGLVRKCRPEIRIFQNRGERFQRREVFIRNANQTDTASHCDFRLRTVTPIGPHGKRVSTPIFSMLATIIRKYDSARMRAWFFSIDRPNITCSFPSWLSCYDSTRRGPNHARRCASGSARATQALHLALTRCATISISTRNTFATA